MYSNCSLLLLFNLNINQTQTIMEEHEKDLRHLPINSINYTEEQKIRSKNLELMRALQDVDRLTSDNVQFKLQIIELKQKIKELESTN